MKKIVFISIILLGLSSIKAQTTSPEDKKYHSDNFSVGFHLNNFQNDFGFGINMTSAYFAKNRMAVSASYNMAYRDGLLKTDSVSTWYPYSSLKLGLVGVGGMIGKSMRMYGGGGVIVLLPNPKFGSNKVEVGGYGVWGFEFILNPRISYYIELGGVGVGATADKMVGKPIYSNGFTSTVGLHVYF